ncbi:bifunctional 4-hydroxy-2-oxoglutarate aldolase/2-dehydro-3-deoxy-phosphogluconate aldolase [uncultured Cyclobacterium sp.]|uniref:bifunctional 4-hydroxy-2-oxoglutarate aldolase/2-dehydro-3-deoxy-phosphogluconate aldolase n=1 Tax=uncultured Cyclobacterium sp. TaxID=453820 RepID=UPI0030EC2D3E|tara:strand:- start:89742 stop:90383 length:642 start_codon:yes stop_codon:yes gene_type:complete
MKKTFSWEAFNKAPIVAIFRNLNSEDLIQVAQCFKVAGLSTMEITLNSKNATKDIERLVSEFGVDLNIGAGTVCDLNDLHAALDAGAQFIVTPVLDKDVIEFCVANDIPVFPGAFTPTEIYTAWKLGANMVKVFPSGALGPSYIKDLLGPLDSIKLLPTGGVSVDNLSEYFKAGASGVGVGSAVVPKSYLQNKDWKGLTEHLELFMKTYKDAK